MAVERGMSQGLNIIRPVKKSQNGQLRKIWVCVAFVAVLACANLILLAMHYNMRAKWDANSLSSPWDTSIAPPPSMSKSAVTVQPAAKTAIMAKIDPAKRPRLDQSSGSYKSGSGSHHHRYGYRSYYRSGYRSRYYNR